MLRNDINFEVDKIPLITRELALPTPYYATVRTDNNLVLGCVSKDYHVVQNTAIKEYLEQVALAKNTEINSCGSLYDGKRVFFQIPLPTIDIYGIIIHRHFTIINSHDKSTAIRIGFTDMVQNCGNNFYRVYTESGKLQRIIHGSGAEEAIKTFLYHYDSLCESPHYDLYKKWMTERIDAPLDYMTNLMNHLLDYDPNEPISTKKQNQLDLLYTTINEELMLSGVEKLTKWVLFNGVTRYTTHNMNVRKNSSREESAFIGQGYTMNNKAFNFIANNN